MKISTTFFFLFLKDCTIYNYIYKQLENYLLIFKTSLLLRSNAKMSNSVGENAYPSDGIGSPRKSYLLNDQTGVSKY